MKTLYLEAENRERKIVRLYNDARLLGEMITAGDFLLAIEALLQKNRAAIKDIGKIEVAPRAISSVSGRVALSIAQALRYALGLWSPTGGGG